MVTERGSHVFDSSARIRSRVGPPMRCIGGLLSTWYQMVAVGDGVGNGTITVGDDTQLEGASVTVTLPAVGLAEPEVEGPI